jgi:hypothetical protein
MKTEVSFTLLAATIQLNNICTALYVFIAMLSIFIALVTATNVLQKYKNSP